MIPMVSKRQIKAARALLGWSQARLARKADIGIASLKRIEGGAPLTSTGFPTVRSLIECLEASGIEFTFEAGFEGDSGFGVRLRKKSP